MEQKMELWKDIKGYESVYQISNLGNLRRLDTLIKFPNGEFVRKGRPIKATKNSKGYMTVILCWNGKRSTKTIHRLVAEAFIIKIPNKNDVNHIDGNPLNNTEDNLEWCCPSYNQYHAYEMKLKGRGQYSGKAKLTDKIVAQIKRQIKDSAGEVKNQLYKRIAKQYKVSRTTIKWIDKGRTWKHISAEE